MSTDEKPKKTVLEVQPNPQKTAREEYGERAVEQTNAYKAVKKLSNENSPWTLTQELLQEIAAGYTIADPDKLPALTVMVEELKKEINIRYAEDEDLKKVLLDSIPAIRSVREWVKKDGWDEAVWGYVRGEGLFTASKRSQVIESLRKRALDRSDTAAKLWLQLSGDLVENAPQDNKSIDIYREINNILHKKKEQA